jgi:deazaflavin-dependent oxidoreductase (nitroreductase family)
MTEVGDYVPSPFERERTQVALYESTDGREGGTLDDRPVIIVTHTGAKSGLTRKSPLMRVEHDGGYALIASYGGAPKHPLWYHNVVTHPVVTVQDGAVTRTFRAREVHGEEKERWWGYAYDTYPKFVEYRASAPREIPVLVLEPVDE